MYTVIITEVEGSGYPEHQYCRFVGTGMGRSPKKAMIMARKELRKSFLRGGSRRDPLWNGTPVYAETKILRNGREMSRSDDSPGPIWVCELAGA